MSPSFLYRALCRVLQPIRLICLSDTDLAIEVVLLRHEVAVQGREVLRPRLQPAERAVPVRLRATAPLPASWTLLGPAGNLAALAP
jgi:hypothetical protein